MNMKVAVCDDSEQERLELVACLAGFFSQEGIAYDIDEYALCEDMLEQDIRGYDIVFLDVEMPRGHISGMEAARRIRTCNDEVAIVFVTNYISYAPDGYAVNAYRYLLKPVSSSLLGLEMGRLVQQIVDARENNSILIELHGRTTSIRKRDVLFVETSPGKNVTFHVVRSNGIEHITHHSSLAYWEQELGGSFFRCHASYLLNLSYVVSIGKESARLSNDSEVPVSRHRRRGFVQAFSNYIGRQL